MEKRPLVVPISVKLRDVKNKYNVEHNNKQTKTEVTD